MRSLMKLLFFVNAFLILNKTQARLTWTYADSTPYWPYSTEAPATQEATTDRPVTWPAWSTEGPTMIETTAQETTNARPVIWPATLVSCNFEKDQCGYKAEHGNFKRVQSQRSFHMICSGNSIECILSKYVYVSEHSLLSFNYLFGNSTGQIKVTRDNETIWISDLFKQDRHTWVRSHYIYIPPGFFKLSFTCNPNIYNHEYYGVTGIDDIELVNEMDIITTVPTTTTDIGTTIDTNFYKQLIHHWPMNNNSSDIIGNADFLGGVNYEYVSDRFGKKVSAIYLKNGFLLMSPGVYFSGDFAITCWVKLREHQQTTRILDFSNEKNSNNVYFSIVDNSLVLGSSININTKSTFATNNTKLNLNEWYHLAAVLENKIASIYIDGRLVAKDTKQIFTPQNIQRKENLVGRKNYISKDDIDSNAVFDDLKIFRGALNDDEIYADWVLNSF